MPELRFHQPCRSLHHYVVPELRLHKPRVYDEAIGKSSLKIRPLAALILTNLTDSFWARQKVDAMLLARYQLEEAEGN